MPHGRIPPRVGVWGRLAPRSITICPCPSGCQLQYRLPHIELQELHNVSVTDQQCWVLVEPSEAAPSLRATNLRAGANAPTPLAARFPGGCRPRTPAGGGDWWCLLVDFWIFGIFLFLKKKLKKIRKKNMENVSGWCPNHPQMIAGWSPDGPQIIPKTCLNLV